MTKKAASLVCLLLISAFLILGISGAQKPEKATEDLKKAMDDIIAISTALADYVVDTGKAPAHAGPLEDKDGLDAVLLPLYIESLPKVDPWGNRYLVFCGTACDVQYGLSGSLEDDFIVFSFGQDCRQEKWIFKNADDEAGLISLKDFDASKDVVMHNGNWIRAPKELIARFNEGVGILSEQ